MKRTIDCPKCEGRGHIMAFAHYANGICFCCNGAKTIEVDLSVKREELGKTTRIKAEWVMNSTEADYEGLSYNKLNAIRTFCHGGFGLQQAYPELLDHFRKVGDRFFFLAQEERLAAL